MPKKIFRKIDGPIGVAWRGGYIECGHEKLLSASFAVGSCDDGGMDVQESAFLKEEVSSEDRL